MVFSGHFVLRVLGLYSPHKRETTVLYLNRSGRWHRGTARWHATQGQAINGAVRVPNLRVLTQSGLALGLGGVHRPAPAVLAV